MDASKPKGPTQSPQRKCQVYGNLACVPNSRPKCRYCRNSAIIAKDIRPSTGYYFFGQSKIRKNIVEIFVKN